MALTIKDELALAWRSLARTEADEGWRKIRIASIDSMNIMAGICYPSGREAILVSFSGLPISKTLNFPQGRGFKVTHEKFEDDSRTWITITRSAYGAFDLFLLMAVDVVEFLKNSKSDTDSVRYQDLLGRIKAWQHFMKPGRDGLTLEEEIGLAGEVLVLHELINTGIDIDSALECWVGPDDGLQDFEIGIGAIEVKSTLAETEFPAKIQSIEQLDDSQRKPLFVAGCRFSVSETGKTLVEIIRSLEEIANKEVRLIQLIELKLIGAGYHHSHAERYTRKLINTDICFWLVDGDFPRLIASNVPSGITSINYTIDLDSVNSKVDSLTTVLKMLEGI